MGSTPVVTVCGENPTEFTINVYPTTPIGIGEYAEFEVVFDPPGVCLRFATIIANNDFDENPYEFTVKGFKISLVSSRILCR